MATTTQTKTARAGRPLLAAIAAAALAAVFSLTGATTAWAADPVWQPPEFRSIAGEGTNYPHIVVAPDGLRTAVWGQILGPDLVVHASHSTDGVTWSTPTSLSPLTGTAHTPEVVVSLDGTLTVVWVYGNPTTGGELQVSQSFNDGASWTPPITLTQATHLALSPQLAVDQSGNLTVLWQNDDGADTVVHARHSPDGGTTWGAAVAVSAAAQDPETPQLTVDSNGAITAVWQCRVAGINCVQSSRSPDGVSWSAPVLLSSPGLSALWPQVVAGPGNDVVAIWSGNSGGTFVIQASHSVDGESWTSPTLLSAAGATGNYPRIAVAGDGAFSAIWSRGGVIQYSRSTDGLSWNTPLSLSTGTGAGVTPQLAVAPDGSVMAIWDRSSVPMGIHASYSADGVLWTAPALLSTSGDTGVTPVVAAAPDSSFVALWRHFNGFVYRVQSSLTLMAPTITSAAPTQPTVDAPYSFQVTASGNWPMTFSMTAGNLPSGLSMSSAGLITGTPTDTNSATFTVTASNGIAPDDSATYTLAASTAPAAPTTVPAELARSGADWLPAVTLGSALLVVGAAFVTLQQRVPYRGRNPQ